ncbi:MAG: hypothetical protein LBS42_06215, partial [Tannerella sp.]|nr:hypothetical protein [Tannerella sp.]
MKKIFLLLCFANSMAVFSQGLWEMPACAWTRKFGDRPISIKMTHIDGSQSETMTKKGMPVGGIGTGSFMYNFCGSFGPFYMKPVVYEERFLRQAAFHVREEVNGKTVAYTLATEDVLPSWNRLKTGDADYKALFPKATFDYNVFQSQISLLQFSPVIKDNYKETSYPVGMFLFKAKNTGQETAKLSFMFTFPNAQYIQVASDTLCGKDNLRPCRHGLFNVLVKDKSQTAIVMGATDPRNPVETQNTAWCIATSSKATYVEMWDGESDGSAIWNDFAKDGTLSNKKLCENSVTPSGALCVSVRLKPGEETVIPFAISWYFPLTGFGEGTVWKKRYTEYFPENQESVAAAKITEEGLKSYTQWMKSVDEWTLPIAENPKCPDWLKAGALNELYYQTFGGSFWENGCMNREKKYGNREGQHIAGVMEYIHYPYLETFDVRHHTTGVT